MENIVYHPETAHGHFATCKPESQLVLSPGSAAVLSPRSWAQIPAVT